MRLFFLLLAALLASCSSGGDDDGGSGRPDRDACDQFGAKIINGTTCSIAGNPVVAIFIDQDGDDAGACSGFVSSPTTVVTAAHCLCDPEDGACRSSTSANVTVVVEGGRRITASSVRVHPGYRVVSDPRQPFGKLQNDVAILNLASAAGVGPLPILRSRLMRSGDIVGIFGYGLDEKGVSGFAGFDGRSDFRLESGEMEVSARGAGFIEALFNGAGSNTCVGDSGGPMTFQEPGGTTAAVGITSIGISAPGELCLPGETSVYTDLQSDSVFEFLRSNVPGLLTQ